MMTRSARYFVAAVCGVLLCQMVYAESKDTDRLKLSLDFSARFSDNRDSAPDGLEENNWDFFLTPRIGYAYYGQRSTVDFFYAPSFRYRENPSIIQNDTEILHDLGIDLKHKPTRRMELRAAEKFTLTDDPSITEGNTTLRNDRSYFINRLDAGVIHQVTRRSNVDVYGKHMIKRYDAQDASNESDEDQLAAGLNVWNRLGQTVSLQAMASYTMYGYEDLFGLQRDFDSVFVGVGLAKDFTKNLSGGVKAGIQSQEYDDSSLDSQVVPSGEIWVKGYTVPTTRLHGSLGHGVRESDAYPYASQEYTEVRAGIEADVTENRRLTLALWGVYRMSSYDEQEGIVMAAAGNPVLAALLASIGSQPSGEETTIELEGGLIFRMTESCHIKLTQRFEDLDSDVGVSFTKNSTALSLSKQF